LDAKTGGFLWRTLELFFAVPQGTPVISALFLPGAFVGIRLRFIMVSRRCFIHKGAARAGAWAKPTIAIGRRHHTALWTARRASAALEN